MKKILMVVTLVLALTGPQQAKAQMSLPNGSLLPVDLQNIAGLDLLAFLGQACALLKASYVCDSAQIASMVDALNKNGWNNLISTLYGLGEGFVYDAIESAGGLICFDAPGGPQCLADILAQSKNWLQTKPSEFIRDLSSAGRDLYLSNILAKYGNPSVPSAAPEKSPQYWAEEFINVNPTIRARGLQAAREDVNASKSRDDNLTAVADQSAVLLDPKKETASPYNTYAANVLTPDCATFAPACNPLDPDGGVIAEYSNKAKTAISTRELMQLMVELEAQKINSEVMGTKELTRKLDDVVQSNIYTMQQLVKIYNALLREKTLTEQRYREGLEKRVQNIYQQNLANAQLFKLSEGILLEMGNPYMFDGVIGGL